MAIAALRQYEGIRRVLLLFGPEESHPTYSAAEEAVVAARDRLDADEIQVMSIYGSGGMFDGTQRLKDVHASEFRQAFGAHRPEFTAILLDYDGSVISRQRGEFNLEAMLGDLGVHKRTHPTPPQREPQPHARGTRSGRHQSDEPPR